MSCFWCRRGARSAWAARELKPPPAACPWPAMAAGGTAWLSWPRDRDHAANQGKGKGKGKGSAQPPIAPRMN